MENHKEGRHLEEWSRGEGRGRYVIIGLTQTAALTGSRLQRSASKDTCVSALHCCIANCHLKFHESRSEKCRKAA